MMQESDREWIKLLVHEAVSEAMAAERELVRAAVEAHESGADHAAFRTFIDSENRKQEQWDKIKTSVIGAMIIGVLFWVGSHTIDIAAWVLKTFGGK